MTAAEPVAREDERRVRVDCPKSKISIAALVPYPQNTTPSQRYRIEQWMPYLVAAGIRVDLFPFADSALLDQLHRPGFRISTASRILLRSMRRFVDLAHSKRYDAILIHRAVSIVGPAWFERLAARMGRPIIYDFDDAIFHLHTTEANRRFGWLKFPGKTATICRLSSHITVGNEYLAEYARRFNPNVTVIPTSVDTDLYRPIEGRKRNGRIVVGWTGSSTSQTYLEMFAPVLEEIVRDERVELRVHSDRPPKLPGIKHVWRQWSAETESEEIGEFDIGIMPMPDDEWARGKCAMKALLYMSMGIPAVCTAVGANLEVISHGENGLLAATSDEWLDNIGRLAGDAALRERLGRAGRRTVEQRYSMRRSAELFADVVRTLCR
ncbi:MAG: glycosyltransferase family 4 protein [Blastocatellales bacterium]|nr:glycosyltransferase family 4 protein [Blastocatellales bacterium]